MSWNETKLSEINNRKMSQAIHVLFGFHRDKNLPRLSPSFLHCISFRISGEFHLNERWIYERRMFEALQNKCLHPLYPPIDSNRWYKDDCFIERIQKIEQIIRITRAKKLFRKRTKYTKCIFHSVTFNGIH